MIVSTPNYDKDIWRDQTIYKIIYANTNIAGNRIVCPEYV